MPATSELRVFTAVLSKNWRLKTATRGIALCSALEVLVPLFFIGLLCLPRYYIPDKAQPAAFYSPVPITSVAWSQARGWLPSGGGYKIFYAPNTADAALVAQAAAVELVCGSEPSPQPSVLRQAALASSFTVNAAGILAAGLADTCASNPLACASFVSQRPGGLPLTSPLVTGDLSVAGLCSPACVSSPACIAPLVASFLVPFATAGDAEAAAAAAGAPVAAVLLLPSSLPDVSRAPPAGGAPGIVYQYTIRTNQSDVPGTAQWGAAWTTVGFDPWVAAPSAEWKKEWFFVNVQRAVDQAVINALVSRKASANISGIDAAALSPVVLGYNVKQAPWVAYTTNVGGAFGALFFGTVLVFAFTVSVVGVVKSLMLEKELRIREALLMAGLSGKAYWASWFVTHFASLSVVSTLIAIAGTYPFEHTNGFVTWLFLLAWTAQLLAFCYALVPLFTSSSAAVLSACLAYILTLAPAVAATSGAAGALGTPGWAAACVLLPGSCIYMFGVALALRENAALGLQFHSLFENLIAPPGSGDFSAGIVLLVTIANGIVFALLAVYLDAVWPRAHGPAPLPWWRPLTLPFWLHRPRRPAPPSPRLPPTPGDGDDDGEAACALIDGGVEAPPAGLAPSIRLRRVCKTYAAPDGSPIKAVDNLSLRLYEGQIGCLLGHNGAGKTTAIGLMCGVAPPTSGSATLCGRDVGTQLTAVRSRLGVCPQHDVLWPSLTCSEHVALYAALRGGTDDDAAAVLADVGLAPKADAPSSSLSGGQRRRLSLACAFVGSPAVVLLDEPTTGVDPSSRRQLWGFLRRRRAGTTILITTHSLFEAEGLADRVVVMAGGRLACAGSPHWLRATLGLGHHTTVVLTRQRLLLGSTPSEERLHAVVRLVASFDPESVWDVGSVGCSASSASAASTLSFLHPRPLAGCGFLPALLRCLEGPRGAELGVESVRVCGPTLSEVFLSIAEAEFTPPPPKDVADTAPAADTPRGGFGARGCAVARFAAAAAPKLTAEGMRSAAVARKRSAAAAALRVCAHTGDDGATAPNAAAAVSHFDDPLRTGWRLVASQFAALLSKRASAARRDALGACLAYGVPVAFVAIGLALSTLAPTSTHALPPATLSSPFYVAHAPLLAAASPSSAAAASRLGDAFAAPFLAAAPRAWAQYACAPPNATSANASSSSPQLLPAGVASTLSQIPALASLLPGLPNTCPSLADAEAAPTLDAALFRATAPHANCRQLSGPCASLFFDAVPSPSPLHPAGAGPSTFGITLIPSPTAFHALPSALASADSAVLSYLLGSPASFDVTSHPLPPLGKAAGASALVLDLLVGLCVVLGLGSLSASSSVYIIAERRSRSKHLQLVSGCGRLTYWASTAAWDVANACVPLSLMVIEFAACGNGAYSSGAGLGVVCASLALFIASALPLSYFLSFFAADEFNGLAAQVGLYGFAGSVQLLAAVVLSGLSALGRASSTTPLALFRWLPHYNVGVILFKLQANAGGGGGGGGASSPWALARPELSCLAAEAAVYGAFTLAMEFDAPQRVVRLVMGCVASSGVRSAPHRYNAEHRRRGAEDAGVAAERARVEAAGGDAGDLLTLVSLSKSYPRPPGFASPAAAPPRAALCSLTLGVAANTCLGLIGVNGAGKSTALKILSGEVAPSLGDARVRGLPGTASGCDQYSVCTDLGKVRQRVGVCPQDDGHPQRLTGKEVLLLYGALRGLSPRDASTAADEALESLVITPLARRLAASYSGGGRRKLSVAMALTGAPPVCLLDEPASGIDAHSRTALWAVLGSAKAGRALVLASHDMEEVERLSDVVALLSSGHLKCFGHPQRLAVDHGRGAALELTPSQERGTAAAVQAVSRLLPTATVASRRGGRVTFALRRGGGAVAEAVEAAAAAVAAGDADAFAIDGDSLESVFLLVAESGAEDGATGGSEDVAPGDAHASPQTPRVVACPSCRRVLAWRDGLPAMRCGVCDALVGVPPDV